MSERVAIVVGAGGELGRATAEKLATAGFAAVGVDRSEERLKELPDGSIVHMTARPGLEPAAGMAAYAVSKGPWSTSPACSTWSCARSGSG